MNVLLLGASGFVGRHVARALTAAGHTLVQPGARIDFAKAVTPAHWLEHLAGVDAVINAVGVLRDTRQRPMWAVHAAAPQALFEACAQAGVRRVIQVSALGVEGNATAYATSRLAAEVHLLALAEQGRVDPVVLRPSVVVGQGGASTALFKGLAAWPWLLLPEPVAHGQAQPVHVRDLADACARLLGPALNVTGRMDVVGPQVFTLQELIAQWRAALGHAPARVMHLPERLSRWSARLGDCVPVSPWGSETLALLAQPNTGDVKAFERLLGRPPVSVGHWPREEMQ